MSNWDLVVNFYKQKFGYPKEITNYLAVRSLLKYHCMGYSNYRIAKRFDVDIQYIMDVFCEFLGTNGLVVDLVFSPLALYKDNKDLESFILTVRSKEEVIFHNELLLKMMFFSCKKFYKYEEKLKEYGN